MRASVRSLANATFQEALNNYKGVENSPQTRPKNGLCNGTPLCAKNALSKK